MEKNGYGRSTESDPYLATLGRVESPDALVVGTTQLFENGQIRYIPMPTPDPKDPLNLPNWRKWAAVAALCFFGALALAAEAIIGALVPVFVLEYAGIDPRILAQIDISALSPPGVVNLNPLSILAGLGGPPVYQVALLASLPLLVNGIASYLLVPLSIAVGRRPVLLFAGMLAWSGGLWAGVSQGLYSHLAARCFQGLGAGAVEALIPLIVQDIMFIHQRNKAIASIGASQGLIIVSLGIASPLIVARLSWRYLYFITSGVGILAWVGLILFVPESRWIRTDDELAGKEIYNLRPGEHRPRLDVRVFGPRTNKTDFGIFNVPQEWARARRSVWETVKTTFFPNILWVITVNSLFVSIQGAAGQVGSSVLIAAGWKFETLGFAVVPIVIASPFVWLFGGYVADKISNAHARRNSGRREPEAHLISLIIPLAAGVAGPLVFGYAAQNIKTLPSIVVLVGIFLIGFAFLTANTLFSVYLVESYPAFAGPVLVNVSSFRLIVGFAMSFNATTWIEQLGFLESFGIYSGSLALVSLGLPFVYLYGKRIRSWTAGQLQPSLVKKIDDDGVSIIGIAY
ncbi:MFS general substrate transporter [Thozetella sp. PMI_491]|nr:MFS general substrate transporter [Thozetella sp. PMI_491]